jgi:hypothetical protein
MAEIMYVMAILPRATAAKACKQFRPCIEAVVEAGGDFFLEIDFTCTSAHYL